jgi:ribosomal protein S18 acetylase RimI-like enzyme
MPLRNFLHDRQSVRIATDEDVAGIVRVLIATKATCLPAMSEQDRDVAFWTARWRSYILDGSKAQLASGDSTTFIVEQDSRPVAFAAYHHTRRHGTDAELQSIYVLPDAQRRGIGSALLRLIAERLVADGSASMCVGYSPENPYKQFYLKHGAVELDPHWAVWRNLPELAAMKGGA